MHYDWEMAKANATMEGHGDTISATRNAIVDTMRGRLLRGLQAGTLRAGARLPSARDLAAEFGVDHRYLISAYKQLEMERLVELRPRGGAYMLPQPPSEHGVPPLPEAWIVEVFVQGLGRELPAPELHEWLRRCIETLRLRAVVIAGTEHQADTLSRELRDDFGFETDILRADVLPHTALAPLAVRRADLLVATQAHGHRARALGAEEHTPVVVVETVTELMGGEWAVLLRRPVYAVVETATFGDMLRAFFSNVPGIENLRIIVHGRDDLAAIPEGAPTYLTQRVRDALRGARVPGRVLSATRMIGPQSARAILAFIVRANLDAMARPGR